MGDVVHENTIDGYAQKSVQQVEDDEDPDWWRRDTESQSLAKLSVLDDWLAGFQTEQQSFTSFALFSEVPSV
jgi:hypothetical protein